MDFTDSSDEETTKDYIQDALIVKFDDETPIPCFSSVKLGNFYFKPLPTDFDTLIFCAFFANHFEFMHLYSYSISRNIESDAYNKYSIEDVTNFSLKNSNFVSFTPTIYYQNKCLLNIPEFIQRTLPLYPKNIPLIDFNKEIEMKKEGENKFLLMNALIEIITNVGAYFYENFTIIDNEDEITTTIENDYNKYFIPRHYIFQAKIDMPYRVTVNLYFTPNRPIVCDYRIAWAIFEDKLIYIDDNEDLHEFTLKTLSFKNKGKNKTSYFKNLVLACYSLDCN